MATISIGKRTIELLKNFGTVNANILIRKDAGMISTMAAARNIRVDANIDEKFPVDVPLFDLNEFLSALTLVEDPELDFHSNHVVIRPKGAKRGGIRYLFASEDMVMYPKETVRLPSDMIEFEIKADQLAQIIKSAAVLGLTHVEFRGDKDGIVASVCQKAQKDANVNEILLSTEAPSSEFSAFVKADQLKMLPGDYQVRLSEAGVTVWTSEDGKYSFMLALE